MSPTLPTTLSAVAADILAAVGIPGGSLLGVSVQALVEKRRGTAREILLEELKGGNIQIAAVEDLEEPAAIFLRYARAAEEGAARINLRLMAKVIAGQAHLGNLIADEFLYYADILASLRREEIIFIATLHRECTKIEADAIDGAAVQEEQWNRVKSALVPNLMSDEDTLMAVAFSTMRTGLVFNDTSFNIDGGFRTSPLMDQLASLASFEDALL